MLFDTPPASLPSFLLDRVWPVGSVFTSVLDTSPADLIGGVWEAIGAGRVLVGLDAGQVEFDTLGETGGAKTSPSSGIVSQPTFTGSALATHSHGVGTLATSAHTGTAVADHASHTHTYTDVPNHVHVQTVNSATTGGTSGYTPDTSTNTGVASGYSTQTNTGGVAQGTTAGPNAALTHTVTQPADHTLSGAVAAVSAGTPVGIVSQPTFAGDPQSVLQPYLVVRFWKRVA